MSEPKKEGFNPPEPTLGGVSDATLQVPSPADATLPVSSATDATLARETPFPTVATGQLAAPFPSPPLTCPVPHEVRTFGDYELLELIARGGMGVVYKARQKKLNRIVAIKMILAGQFADEMQVERFYAEAEAAANLRHPNIVAVHEIGVVDNQHFFSMDFIEGKSLADLVRDQTLSPRKAAEYMRCISETMQFAHDRGILHRDLKPSNILVDKRDEPLITDFGLAKQVSGQSQLTVSGAVVGTPSYMPPEQAAGRNEQAGPTSDIYSLGAILYELIAGRPPFRAATPFETIRQVLEMEPVSPRVINPSVPRDLETICLKCLQKDQSRRYSSAADLAEELRRFMDGEPILARPVGRVEWFWRLCKRNPKLSSAIAVAITFLIMTVIASWVGWRMTSNALSDLKQSTKLRFDAVDALFTRVSEDTLLMQPGTKTLRKDLLRLALSYYEPLLKENAKDPELKNELAATYFRIGVIYQELKSKEQGLEQYRIAREMQIQLLAERPNDPKRLLALGNTLNAMGTALAFMEKFDEALPIYDEAIRIRTRLVELTNRDPDNLRVLANTYMNQGLVNLDLNEPELTQKSYEKAQQLRQEALQRRSNDSKTLRDVAKGKYNSGNLWLREGAAGDERAASDFESAAQILVGLLNGEPRDMDNQQLLGICYRILGDLSAENNKIDDARNWYQQSTTRLRLLTEANPDVETYKLEYAGLLMNVGLLETEAASVVEARTAFEGACNILAPIVELHPGEIRFRYDLAFALSGLGEQQIKMGENSEGMKNLIDAKKHLERLKNEMSEDDVREKILPRLQSIDELLQSTASSASSNP